VKETNYSWPVTPNVRSRADSRGFLPARLAGGFRISGSKERGDSFALRLDLEPGTVVHPGWSGVEGDCGRAWADVCVSIGVGGRIGVDGRCVDALVTAGGCTSDCVAAGQSVSCRVCDVRWVLARWRLVSRGCLLGDEQSAWGGCFVVGVARGGRLSVAVLCAG
jgi:hypothetical protein